MAEAGEWRTRAIWDAIDGGSYKQALQLCAKHLKKSPDSPVFQSLAALANLRMGKADEALKLSDAARKAGSTDPAVLSVLAQVYTSMGKRKEVAQMYEAATNAAPKNEELASLWFMALVKDMAFKEQQAAALKLNRQFKAAKYTTWAAAAARIQASEDPSNSNMMLALAERLAAKAWTDAVEPNLEVALFYLDLLLDQSKFNEALAFLDEEKTAKSFRVAAQRHKLRAELLVKLGRNREAKDQCLELLDKREDDWEAWMLLMEASTASTGESGWSVGELRKYLADRTAAAGEDGRRRRALLLVGLELIRREGLTMDLAKRLVDYVELHKSAYHLVGDVSRFLAALDEGGRAFLLRQIRSTLVEGEQKDIGAFANRIKLERLLGSHEGLTVHDAEELSGSLWATYLQTREQKGASNLQHAEDLALLASHLLLDISLKSGDASRLIRAINALEAVLETSPSNFQVKLLLIRLWTNLGGWSRAWELFSTLGIKHTLKDTLSYILLDVADLIVSPDQVDKLLSAIQIIYVSNESETPQMLVKAYENGSYTKIAEFRTFMRRLQTSMSRAIHSSIGFRNDVAKQMGSGSKPLQIPLLDSVQSDSGKHSDNQDRDLFANWNPHDRPTVEQLSQPTDKRGEMWITLQRSLFLVMREGFEGFVQDAPLEELRCAIKEAETGLDVSVFELVCARLTCALATLLRGETESGAVAALDATGALAAKTAGKLATSDYWNAGDMGALLRSTEALAIARLMLKQRQDAAVKRNPAAKSAVAEAYSAAQSSTLAVTNAVSALKKSRPQHAREGQGESHLPASALKSLVRDYEAFISEIERRLR